jgi:glycosyltransferase involved in cell wall biosynthesis/Flp pilus assembly protein TadD
MKEARIKASLPRMEADAGDPIQTIINKASQEISGGHSDLAVSLLREAVERLPDSIELLTTAALLSLQAGAGANAEIYLLKALKLSPTNKDVLHNLALLYWSEGKTIVARDMFQRLVDADPGDADSLNDLAVFEDQCDNVGDATTAFKSAVILPGATRKVFENCFEFLLRVGDGTAFRSIMGTYLSRYGDDDVAHKWQTEAAQSATAASLTCNSQVIDTDEAVQGLKIAFFASFQSFLDPIMNDLRAKNEIKLFTSGNETQMREMLEWCDVAWFEWCDNLVIAATKMPKVCKIICRLHSYEVFTEMPSQVDWRKIDHLVLVNQSVQEILKRTADPKVPITIIHNGVDTDKFTIPPGKKYGKRICSIGYINYKKNPALLLYCFKAIHDYDSSYRFHIAGTHQDPRIQIYFEHLLPKLNLSISFDGWVDNIPGYLRDKDYVISASLFESFHYSIAEGMASGLTPLIHDWLGASYLYPEEFLFTTPQSCLDLLKRLETEDRSAIGHRCRDFIVHRYEQKRQMAKINALIRSVAEGAL